MDASNETNNDDVTIDETVRFKGKVSKFDRRRGFGSIIPDGKGEDDKIFAHWRQIESSDEWPALKEGMVVEYYVGKKESGKRKSQKEFAAKITLEGGNPVTIASEKTYPNRSQRFQGKVKFFDARKGFGFVLPATDFSFDGTDFKTTGDSNIHIAREDIKTTADCAPSLKDGQEIEFTLFKNEGKGYSAGDVTKQGGEAFAEEDMATKKTGWPRRRKFNNGGKKGGKGGFGGFKFPKGMMNMGGMGGMFMMNGMPYMMMPVQGGKRKGKGRW